MIDFDIYDHALQDDPYPAYARLREEAPLFHQSEHDYWVVSRHADVHAGLRDDTTFSNSRGVTIDASAWNENAATVMSFLAMDAPGQTRLRRLVSAGFTPRRVRDLAPSVEEMTARYLDQALTTGDFDWIGDVAGLIPMDVISEMMGVPEADRVEVRRLADLLAYRQDGLRDVPPAGIEAALTLMDYYSDHVAEKRKNPGDDLVSALLSVEDGGDRMTEDEVGAFLFLMVVAGNETTTKLLGNAVFHLTAHPEQAAQVIGDPSLVDQWVEETLRYDGSTQFVARLVRHDYALHDLTVPAGSKLVFALGAANHDPEVFSRPDVFDIHRTKAEVERLVSFGGGRHFCLGAHLARLEARIVLRQLVERVRTVEVDHDACVRFYSANVRGFAHVPMQVTPR